MTTWNEIPFDPNADAQQKADEFDRQIEENREAYRAAQAAKPDPYQITGGANG